MIYHISNLMAEQTVEISLLWCIHYSEYSRLRPGNACDCPDIIIIDISMVSSQKLFSM